jgi:hypothetical protein
VVPKTEELMEDSEALLEEIRKRKHDDRLPIRWREVTGG